jgi:hypothetical protein
LQLKKQTEIQAAQQAALEAKEQAEQLRKGMRELELAEVCSSEPYDSRSILGSMWP